jgi:hypothetical protein
MEEIREILSSYIEARTAVLRANSGVFFTPNSTKEYTTFDNMVNAHHQMIADKLPPMNLTELEAFAELMNSRLAFIRMHKMPGKYQG